MKEKYQYSTVKDTTTPEALILFAGLGLMIYLCANHSDLERLTFWILTFICVSVLGCWIGRFIFPIRVAADDYAVTFSRIFRKKIPYSSIKSIDLRTEKRTYKTKSGNRTVRHTTTTEIITFHCEKGDHSFASELESSQKSLAWVNNSTIVSPDDTTYSPFSRLKVYIEERIPIMQID
jgi:hypothetical protein